MPRESRRSAPEPADDREPRPFLKWVGGQLLEQFQPLLPPSLWRKGVRVMLSNSDTPSVRALYAGFRIDVVHAGRSINSRASKTGKVREVVVRNYVDRELLPCGG
jgi:site-specific DNA-adenine methylase